MEESVNLENITDPDMKTDENSQVEKTAKEVMLRYSSLALAYIGDSIYDLLVKKHFVMKINMKTEKYHKIVTSIVSANAQSEFIRYYMDSLTEQEKNVLRMGRNSSPHSKAKNASVKNYLDATGMEALLGFLYLCGNEKRLQEIVDASIEYKEKKL